MLNYNVFKDVIFWIVRSDPFMTDGWSERVKHIRDW